MQRVDADETILGAWIILMATLTLGVWFVSLCSRTLATPDGVDRPTHLWNRAVEWFWLLLLAVPVVSLGVLAVLFPADATSREAPRRASCLNNLKQIGLALHNYHDAYGCFPPACTTDKDGRPLHSWRVLIVPYLESRDFYDQLRLEEPWDSPHNRAVAREWYDGRAPCYRCSSDRQGDPSSTSYVMLTGPGTISDGGSSSALEAITDGPEQTIIVVEMARSGIHWMEPRDLDLREMSFRINDLEAPGVRSDHPGVVHVVTADGAGHTLHNDLPEDDLRALATIAGGEEACGVLESKGDR